MKAGSLFAGIGGFDLALRNVGIEVIWQVEKHPQCHAVLEARFPECKLYEDVRDVGANVLDPVELVVGGFPCQGLSVAGRREGLDDERSGLWYEFHRILAEITPDWVLIENVPGLLSSDGGRDMAVVLGGLAELGYWWTYRVLDSQYFNVPQRRARVFIVGHYGTPCPPEILFEPESVFRDPATRRATREAIADGTISRALSRVGGGDDPGANKGAPIVTEGSRINSGPDGISGAVSAKWLKGTGGPAGDEAYNLIVDGVNDRVSPALDAHYWKGPGERGGDERAVLVDRQVGALNARDSQYPENRDAEQVKLIVTPFDSTQITHPANYSSPKPGDPSPTIATTGHPPKVIGVNVYPESGQGADLIARETETAMALTPNSHERKTDRGTFVFKASHFTRGKDGAPSEITPPLSADADKGDQDLLAHGGHGFVRRLTPRECERLQGFPDDFTLVEYEGKLMKDGPRFRMLGNAVTVPVVEWVARRLLQAANVQPDEGL